MNDVIPPRKQEVLINVSALSVALAGFARERDWDQFHSPKNLVMALSAEVGELTEVFQWLSEDASKNVGDDSLTTEAVRDELADVAMYLVRLASVLGVDLNDAVTQKLKKNSEKYPVSKARGNHKKYDQL